MSSPKGSFYINKSDWTYLKRKQQGRQIRDLQWTNIMATGIGNIYPLCTFAFKHHAMKCPPLCTCKDYCSHRACPLPVAVEEIDEATLEANVSFQGEACHQLQHDCKRRPIRSIQSDRLSKIQNTVQGLCTSSRLEQYPKRLLSLGAGIRL